MNSTTQPIIYVVDDEPAVQDALSTLFLMENYSVRTFADGATFLAAVRQRMPNLIMLDVHMPGRSGLDILKELNAQHLEVPIFIISGQGDIPMAVEAIKHGAMDFLEKPLQAQDVLVRVAEALEANKRRQEQGSSQIKNFAGSDLLTPREHDVLHLIASGLSNKEAGRQLGISPRTIEVHRARIMEKLGARNAADLVRIVMQDS